jgi:hypothetical protein
MISVCSTVGSDNKNGAHLFSILSTKSQHRYTVLPNGAYLYWHIIYSIQQAYPHLLMPCRAIN